MAGDMGRALDFRKNQGKFEECVESSALHDGTHKHFFPHCGRKLFLLHFQ